MVSNGFVVQWKWATTRCLLQSIQDQTMDPSVTRRTSRVSRAKTSTLIFFMDSSSNILINPRLFINCWYSFVFLWKHRTFLKILIEACVMLISTSVLSLSEPMSLQLDPSIYELWEALVNLFSGPARKADVNKGLCVSSVSGKNLGGKKWTS